MKKKGGGNGGSKNSELARLLREMGFLTEMGDDSDNAQFRARAYYRAADSVEGLQTDISRIYAEGGIGALLQIPAIARQLQPRLKNT